MKEIIKMFETGNVCVCGLRGRGKDMLIANVIWRRKKPYISNVDYGGDSHPFNPMEFDCGRNTYKDFISNDVKQYVYPYADETDIYVSDAGILFPAHFCNELNKLYPYFPTFFALTRQLGECNFHINVQNLNRLWDKIREQSDLYIMCNHCFVIFGWVLQCVTIYELYDSAVKRVPPFRIRKPLINPERRFQWEMAYQNYLISHGEIKRKWLLYKNLSNYNTRIFKEVLENGKENFVDPSKLSVIIPYSDLEKFMNLARDMEVMKAQYARMQEQYSAIYGMFSEVLQIVRETREFVKDT